MEQGRDRCRGDHRSRQPVVERHDAVLGKTEETEDIEHRHQHLVHVVGEDPGRDVGGEVEGAGQYIDQDHRRQQEELGGRRQVNDVFTCPFVTFRVLMMGDQWVGADRNDLVEQIHRQKIVGKGHPDGPEDRKGETGVEAGLGVFFEPPHIPHRIVNGDGPQR